MRRNCRLTAFAVGGALAASVVACAAEPVAPAAATPPPAPAAAPANTPYAEAGPLTEKPDFAKQLENFEAAKFSNPTKITNTWLPLAPGTQRIYTGTAVQEGETVQRRFVLTVTDLTKTILGVRTVVVWDQDFDNGTLTESELAFFAQADNGDLWQFGEYPEEYEDGKLVSNLTWMAGIAGARPGITVKEAAEIGSPSYSQGYSPVAPWTDRARTAKVGVRDCVPQGCYENMIVTDEFNREEPGAVQQKFYAPRVGNTRVSFTGNDASKELLELSKVTQLDPAGLDAVRVEALKLDASGIQRSREAYAQSSPIEKPPGK